MNFQADANDIVAGWLVDDGDAFGLRSGGEIYGWVLSGDPNDPNSNYQAVERDPNVPCSALKKTLNFMKNESLGKDYDWEFSVDNGVYYVEITAGDPDGDSSDPNIYSSCRYILNAEGVEVLDGVPTSSKRWISGSATVTVTDGRLTISGDSGALHNCISYVKFLKAPIGEMPSSVDLEFSYDDDPVTGEPGRGNLLADAHYEYVWDASDRIIEITDKTWESGDITPQKVSYVYDAMGRRVLTRWHYVDVFNDIVLHFAMVYDGVAPIQLDIVSPSYQAYQRFYYEAGINKPALVEKFDAAGLTGAYVPLTDDRGTVVGVYDVKVGNSTYGQLVEKLHYNATGLCKSFDPNGVENLTPGTDINIGRSFYDIPFGWCGMARDAFTGLYHTHFRDYDPVHGRWLSEDPAGYADGMNLYAAYMGVNGVDVLGLGAWDDFKSFSSGVGSGIASGCGAVKDYVFDEKDKFDAAAESWLKKKHNVLVSNTHHALGKRAGTFVDKGGSLIGGTVFAFWNGGDTGVMLRKAFDAKAQDVKVSYSAAMYEEPDNPYAGIEEINFQFAEWMIDSGTKAADKTKAAWNGDVDAQTDFALILAEILLAKKIHGLKKPKGPNIIPKHLPDAKNKISIDKYGNLSKNTDITGQAHHLNQNAAYREVIPYKKGISTKLEGNAFTEIGSPHYVAHESMEQFWNQYRRRGELFGSNPTNFEYTKALKDSLRSSGLSETQINQALKAAIRQRLDYGLFGGMDVPRIPRKINQTGR